MDIDNFDEYEDSQFDMVEDQIPEIDYTKESKTKRGYIVQLGRNRLMCGDASDANYII